MGTVIELATLDYTKSLNYFSDSDRKKILVKFLENADTNISDIAIYEHEEDIGPEFRPFLKAYIDVLTRFNIPKEIFKSDSLDVFTNVADTGKIALIDAKIQHKYKIDDDGKIAFLPHTLESEGTKRSIVFAHKLTQSIIQPSLLLIDEIENSLHLEMVKYSILTYLLNSVDSQLIFTTHNLLLMDWDIMRNDVLWFTEKKDDGSTDLYALTDFNGVNRKKLLKQYMAGSLGAFPDIYQYKFDLESLKEKTESKEK
jgi:AAA15 family ATPase/GTPase